MQLLTRVLLVAVFITSVGYGMVYSQCAVYTPNSGSFLAQNPEAKAAMIAAASEDIEERIDSTTGEIYYVKRLVNPWSNSFTYQIVYFNPGNEQFEVRPSEENPMPTAHYMQNDNPQKPCPDTVPRDSCKNYKSSRAIPQPRRSSTIKIADRF